MSQPRTAVKQPSSQPVQRPAARDSGRDSSAGEQDQRQAPCSRSRLRFCDNLAEAALNDAQRRSTHQRHLAQLGPCSPSRSKFTSTTASPLAHQPCSLGLLSSTSFNKSTNNFRWTANLRRRPPCSGVCLSHLTVPPLQYPPRFKPSPPTG